MSQDNSILPPRYDSPLPVIPPNSRPPLELLVQEEDQEDTVRMQVPPHLLEQSRRGPNWGLMGALLFCLAFWGSVIYLFWRAHG